MKDSVKRKIIIGGGALAVVGGLLLLPKLGGKTLLSIAQVEHGTVTPVPGTHEYSKGETVILTATPAAGYFVNEWRVDGVSKGTSLTLPLRMDSDHRVVLTFTTTNNPTRVPVSMVCISTAPTEPTPLTQEFHGYWRTTSLTKKIYELYYFDGVQLGPSKYANVSFKVLDQNGLPCPNIPVMVHVGTYNDIYDGRLYIADTYSSPSQPIEFITNAEGIISLPIAYHNENVYKFCKNHIVEMKTYLFVNTTGYCVSIGQEVNRCQLINGCTSCSTHVVNDCPDCVANKTCIAMTRWESPAPVNSLVSAYYAHNPNVASLAYIAAKFAIEHKGNADFEDPATEPSGTNVKVYHLDYQMWIYLPADTPGLPDCGSGIITYSQSQGFNCS